MVNQLVYPAVLNSLPVGAEFIGDTAPATEDELGGQINSLLSRHVTARYPEVSLPNSWRTSGLIYDVKRLAIDMAPIIKGMIRNDTYYINLVSIPMYITDEHTFNMHKLEILPMLPQGQAPGGTAPLLETRESIKQSRTTQFALAFELDGEYARLVEGAERIAMFMTYISRAFSLYMAKMTITALLVCSPEKPWTALTNMMDLVTLEQQIMKSVAQFGAVNKGHLEYGSQLFAMCAEMERVHGVRPTCMYIPHEKAVVFLNNPQMVEFRFGGQEAVDLFKGRTTGSVGNLHGVNVFPTPVIPDGMLAPYSQLESTVTIGNHRLLAPHEDQRKTADGTYQFKLFDRQNGQMTLLTWSAMAKCIPFYELLDWAKPDQETTFRYWVVQTFHSFLNDLRDGSTEADSYYDFDGKKNSPYKQMTGAFKDKASATEVKKRIDAAYTELRNRVVAEFGVSKGREVVAVYTKQEGKASETYSHGLASSRTRKVVAGHLLTPTEQDEADAAAAASTSLPPDDGGMVEVVRTGELNKAIPKMVKSAPTDASAASTDDMRDACVRLSEYIARNKTQIRCWSHGRNPGTRMKDLGEDDIFRELFSGLVEEHKYGDTPVTEPFICNIVSMWKRFNDPQFPLPMFTLRGKETFFTHGESLLPKTQWCVNSVQTFWVLNDPLVTRPFERFRMMCAILMAEGIQTGFATMSPPMTDAAVDPTTHKNYAHVTKRGGVHIPNTERVKIWKNMIYHGHKEGGAVRLLDHAAAEKLRRRQFEFAAADDACMYVIPVPKGQFREGSYLNLQGQHFINTDHATEEQYAFSRFWFEFFGWTSCHPSHRHIEGQKGQIAVYTLPCRYEYVNESGNVISVKGNTHHGNDGEYPGAEKVMMFGTTYFTQH